VKTDKEGEKNVKAKGGWDLGGETHDNGQMGGKDITNTFGKKSDAPLSQ